MLNHALNLAAPEDPTPTMMGANGTSETNIHSLATDEAAAAPPSSLPVESRLAEPSASSSNNPDSSHHEESNDTAAAAEPPHVSVPTIVQSADAIIDAAINTSVEDTTALSTVPPLVESQESDVRDEALPTPEAPTEALPQQSSTGSDSQANGVLSAPIETSAPTSTPSLTLATSDPALSQLTLKEEVPSQTTITEQPQTTSSDLSMNMDTSTASAQPTASIVEQPDTEMADASQPTFTKVAREREDDMEIEPSAKRAKTDDEAESQDRTAQDAPVGPPNGESPPAKPDSNSITTYESKEIVKVLKNILRTNDGKNFRAPVSTLWPNFAEAYYAKVPNPIDLGTIETKVRDGQYPTWGDFRADIQLIADNAMLFNGENHPITKAGETVRNSLFSKTAGIPAEPVIVPKPVRKQARRSTPQAESTPRAASQRRPSRSAGSGAVATSPSQTFALEPTTGTPLIRRDSTKNEGGRPKREIHPPKNKDLPYSVRPKARKFASELRFCEETLNEMKKPKHAAFASAFYVPVDPVALNIPNYFTTIKNPMDLSTVAKKLQSGAYQRAKDFEADVRLIFTNCYKFNPQGNPVREMGKQLEAVFEEKWASKQQWDADNAPAAQSPSISGSDDEETEDEDPDPNGQAAAAASATAAAALSQRLIEEQTKLITLMQAKNPDQGLIQMQHDMVALVQSRIAENAKTTTTVGKKAPKKAKAPKTAKKPVAKKISNKKAPRPRYLGTLEKETISAGLASLPDEVAESVLQMIKNDKPDVDASYPVQANILHILTTTQAAADGTLELDIDMISTATLWKIHALILQYAPDVEVAIKRQMMEKESPRTLAKPAPKKKNKPMSKTEQERKIEQLRNSMQEFERHNSGSQEPVLPSKLNCIFLMELRADHLSAVEQAESSGDEDSDDSEEE